MLSFLSKFIQWHFRDLNHAHDTLTHTSVKRVHSIHMKCKMATFRQNPIALYTCNNKMYNSITSISMNRLLKLYAYLLRKLSLLFHSLCNNTVNYIIKKSIYSIGKQWFAYIIKWLTDEPNVYLYNNNI